MIQLTPLQADRMRRAQMVAARWVVANCPAHEQAFMLRHLLRVLGLMPDQQAEYERTLSAGMPYNNNSKQIRPSNPGAKLGTTFSAKYS